MSFDFVAAMPPSQGDDATPASATGQCGEQVPIVANSAGAHVGAPCPATSCSAGVLTGGPPSPAVGPPLLPGDAYGRLSASGLSPFCRIPSLAISDLTLSAARSR